MWRSLLDLQIKAKGRTKVAKELGYSPSTLSMILNEKYQGSTERFEERVMSLYLAVECPHLLRQLEASECRGFRTRSVPTSDPRQLRHWVACQNCTLNPDKENA